MVALESRNSGRTKKDLEQIRFPGRSALDPNLADQIESREDRTRKSEQGEIDEMHQANILQTKKICPKKSARPIRCAKAKLSEEFV